MKPTPTEIKKMRLSFGLTQDQAGKLIHSSRRTWQDWEAGVNAMHPALWELFKIKVRGTPGTK